MKGFRRSELGVAPQDGGGSLVIVLPNRPAAKAGLHQGDAVREVSRRLAKSAAEFKSLVSNSYHSNLLLTNRGGHAVFIAVDRNA